MSGLRSEVIAIAQAAQPARGSGTAGGAEIGFENGSEGPVFGPEPSIFHGKRGGFSS